MNIQIFYIFGKDGAPWTSEVPELSVYDWRGCRMLDRKCWSGKCFQCKWAAMANVTIEYNWGITQKHRFASFVSNEEPGLQHL